MPNVFAKAVVLAVIAGGFAFTGDLGWIASRGRRLLEAADVAAPTMADQPPSSSGPVAAPAVEPPAPVPPPEPPPKAVVVTRAEPKPPAGGCEQVAWTALRPGDRVVVWLAVRDQRCLVLDVVDPAAGESLAYEVAAAAEDGRPLAAAAPPRRVVVGRPADGPPAAFLSKGGMVHIAPAGIAAAGNDGRWLGPIEALFLHH